MGLTLLVSHDSAVGSLGFACVGPLKGVFFFRFLAEIYKYNYSLLYATIRRTTMYLYTYHVLLLRVSILL